MANEPDSHGWIRLGAGWDWDALEPGMRFVTSGRTITEADLVSFVNTTGMTEELFVDEFYLYHETPFRRRLVPAALVYSLAEGLVLQGGLVRYTGIAFLEMHLTVKQPTYVGDTIHVRVTITEKRATHDPGRGLVWAKNEVVNEAGTVVLEYTPLRLVRRASPGPAEAAVPPR